MLPSSADSAFRPPVVRDFPPRVLNAALALVFALVLMVFTPSSQAITGEDGLLEHCYRAFLNRDPDQGGLDYWRGVLASGHGDAYAFMFSAEFNALATQIVTSQ